jgi:hypothetical protein
MWSNKFSEEQIIFWNYKRVTLALIYVQFEFDFIRFSLFSSFSIQSVKTFSLSSSNFTFLNNNFKYFLHFFQVRHSYVVNVKQIKQIKGIDSY